jgi:hypothetical protein
LAVEGGLFAGAVAGDGELHGSSADYFCVVGVAEEKSQLGHDLFLLRHLAIRSEEDREGGTLGSWIKAPPVFAPGGSSPVVIYFRHSIMVCISFGSMKSTVFPEPLCPTIKVNGGKNLVSR